MRRTLMQVILGVGLVLGATNAGAQGPGGEGHPHPFGGPIELMGFEGMHDGKLVKGAPFSAQSNSETTQTLQDGTVIHRTSQGALYRDGEGRLRHEATLSGIGPLAAAGGAHTLVMIADPVAGVHYMLNADKKVAHKMNLPGKGKDVGNSDGASAFQQEMHARKLQDEASGALKTESLGTQMVNGVNAEGTRTTHTIAAGEIGNDKPILVVSERWYSPDLQTVVKSTRTDPRFGTSTYVLTSIQKGEPAATLFAVPSEYTIKTGGFGGHGGRKHGPPPPDAPPLAPMD